MITVLLILIKAIMQNSVKLESQVAMEAGAYSIMAEYHKELFEQYGLLFLDLAYDTGIPKLENANERLKTYIIKNCADRNLVWSILYKDMLNLEVEVAEVRQIQLATDTGMSAFRKQAIEFVKEKYGIKILEDILMWVDSMEDFSITLEEIENMFNNSFDEVAVEDIETLPFWNPQLFQNFDLVREDKVSDFLFYLFKEKSDTISNKKIDQLQYFSMRDANRGNGQNSAIEYTESLMDKLFFQRYIVLHTSNCLKLKESEVLDYELEYVLYGKESDFDNLAAVTRELFFIRQISNMTHIYTDHYKSQNVQNLAALIGIVTKTEAALGIYETLIVLLWSFAESIVDIRSLFEGERIPLFKTYESWYWDITLLVDVDSFLSGINTSNQLGLVYEDYLGILLSLKDSETITKHFLDVVEMNIRNTVGNQNFRIDGCSDSLEIEVLIKGNNVESKFYRWCGFYE